MPTYNYVIRLESGSNVTVNPQFSLSEAVAKVAEFQEAEIAVAAILNGPYLIEGDELRSLVHGDEPIWKHG